MLAHPVVLILALAWLAHPAALVALRQHDNDGALLLQDHLPEVVTRFRQRPLSGDILCGMLVALDTHTKNT